MRSGVPRSLIFFTSLTEGLRKIDEGYIFFSAASSCKTSDFSMVRVTVVRGNSMRH